MNWHIDDRAADLPLPPELQVIISNHLQNLDLAEHRRKMADVLSTIDKWGNENTNNHYGLIKAHLALVMKDYPEGKSYIMPFDERWYDAAIAKLPKEELVDHAAKILMLRSRILRDRLFKGVAIFRLSNLCHGWLQNELHQCQGTVA